MIPVFDEEAGKTIWLNDHEDYSREIEEAWTRAFWRAKLAENFPIIRTVEGQGNYPIEIFGGKKKLSPYVPWYTEFLWQEGHTLFYLKHHKDNPIKNASWASLPPYLQRFFLHEPKPGDLSPISEEWRARRKLNKKIHKDFWDSVDAEILVLKKETEDFFNSKVEIEIEIK